VFEGRCGDIDADWWHGFEPLIRPGRRSVAVASIIAAPERKTAGACSSSRKPDKTEIARPAIRPRGTGTNTTASLSASPEDSAAPMRLRGEAPRVTRISRKVLAGLGVVAGVGIGGALIYALQTADRQQGGEELVTTDRRQTADGQRDLPSDYTGIPQLGPALPGDLGGPIVRAREEGRPIRCPCRSPIRKSSAALPSWRRRVPARCSSRRNRLRPPACRPSTHHGHPFGLAGTDRCSGDAERLRQPHRLAPAHSTGHPHHR